MQNTKLNLLLFLLFISTALFAQKGIPPKEDTQATTITNFSTNIEFSPAMVS